MKSNEFNNVTVTNEKNNISGEFTKAQNTEYSFQSENPTTIKDELNDRHIVNDDPEENLLKATKEKEERKKENKNENEKLESTSTTDSEASMASSASASASSAGGAVAGVAASAATAAVVVIGAVAGISIIEQQKEQENLITFVSSDITTNSIDFVFRMPASLLSYGEEQMSDMSSKKVIGELANSDGYYQQDEYFFEEIDVYTLEGYGHFDGLSPNTSYALTITMFEYTYSETQEVVENPTQLAFRAFTTLPQKSLITFDPLDVTSNSVSFSFVAALSDLGYDPENPSMPSLFATLDDRSLTLTEYESVDNDHVRIFGSFSQLQPLTTYTLEIYLEVDRESKLLGSKTFKTLERTSSVVFSDINVERTYMSFSFTVAKEDIDYVEGSTPAVQMIVSDNSDYYQEVWLQEYEEYDENTIQGWGSFTDLTLNSSFDLIIKLSRQSEFIELGSTTFDNYSGFQWVIDPTKRVTSTGVEVYNFAIKKAYIGYISDEETPDVIDKIHAEVMLKEGGSTGAYRLNTIQEYDTEYCTCLGSIDGLIPETDYILNIYYQPGNEGYELLGSCDFITKEDPSGLIIGDIESSSSWARIPFEINSSYVDLSGQTSNITSIIEFNAYQLSVINIDSSAFTEKSDSKLQAEIYIDNLPANTIFNVEIDNGRTGETYGSKEFATSQSDYGLVFTDVVATSNALTAECYVDPNAFNIDWTDQSAVSQLENQIYIEYFDAAQAESYQPQYISGLSRTSSDVADGKFEVSGLTPSTKYYIKAYYDDGNNNVTFLGMTDFTTNAGVTNVEGGANNSFYVVEDGNSAYRMPIRITYTGDGSDFGENFIINLTTAGMAQPITASVSVSEGYQYALFDELTISRYFGETMNFTITCDENTDTVLYEDQTTIVDVSSSGTNAFFAATDLTTDLYSGNSVNFSLFPVCALGVPSLLEDATLVITGGNISYEYELDLSTFGYVSSVSVDLLVDKNNTLLSFSALKSAWENQSMTIEIVYRASATTGDTTTFVVTSGFTFNFFD